MRFILYTNRYSPHELPLFLACAEVFDDAVYVVNQPWIQDGSRKGWCPDLKGRKTIILQDVKPEARESVFAGLLSDDSLLMYGCYDTPYQDLICKSKGIVIYASERWLKPLCVRAPLLNITLKIPGIAHLLNPRFIVRVFSLVGRLWNSDRLFYFPQGVYAACDVARLCGLMRGDLRCLYHLPKPDFERKPGGKICFEHGDAGKRYCLDKMRMWGYFVEPSQCPNPHSSIHNSSTLKILWVGRLLNWKRVDTIIKAVGQLSTIENITLDIYGEGPEFHNLSKLAIEYGDAIRFHPFVAMEEIRGLMRAHDVYVLSSNEYEGWGAVVSEALEEGMCVLCSKEAGAGATILPDECLFPCGDVDGLAQKLRNLPAHRTIGPWTAKNAAQALLEFAVDLNNEED